MDPVVGKTLKIVVLVRAPRGFMNSRYSVNDWCVFSSCNDPLTACNDLQSDVLAAFEIKKKIPCEIIKTFQYYFRILAVDKTDQLKL